MGGHQISGRNLPWMMHDQGSFVKLIKTLQKGTLKIIQSNY